MRVAVLSKNIFLYQKIRLTLLKKAQVELIDELCDADGFDICLADTDTIPKEKLTSENKSSPDCAVTKIVTIGNKAELQIPFTFDSLCAILDSEDTSTKKLTLGERCAYLRGERIPLTEVEYSLLRMLYDAGGEFVNREELRLKVWDENTDSGVVNVYVYYLRQKLERGEKIINTSRKLGYKIDKNYLGGGNS